MTDDLVHGPFARGWPPMSCRIGHLPEGLAQTAWTIGIPIDENLAFLWIETHRRPPPARHPEASYALPYWMVYDDMLMCMTSFISETFPFTVTWIPS